MDIEKFVRYSSGTLRSDKFAKTIGYGAGSIGHLLALAAKEDSDTSTGLKQLSSSISMARYVIRFTGALESYEAIKNNSWCYGDDDKHLQQIVKYQAYSMLVYYPLEHVSYIGYVAPKLLKIDANWFMRQSCWAWTAYVALDLYANQLRIMNLNKREKKLLADKDMPVDEKLQELASLRKRRTELYYLQLRNACFFPTCLHWSLERGLIPEPLVQFLCFAEAITGFWRTWVNFN
ncbi:hypothetical protein Poli38472_012993 [Pythium oligandrum]|uniref:Peroxisomal membrane protein 11C n=1 Tax=Pythium oligandrum TaxID=41045 RepID=A0A8K1CIT4_PYTOL|nr:hypothetical protein Poli38472_012993 [Pythium oligandrum]|eukprot:TMW64371.1 hypothetical protein Poli38472_012993 [Pythium oligandrum]